MVQLLIPAYTFSSFADLFRYKVMESDITIPKKRRRANVATTNPTTIVMLKLEVAVSTSKNMKLIHHSDLDKSLTIIQDNDVSS